MLITAGDAEVSIVLVIYIVQSSSHWGELPGGKERIKRKEKMLKECLARCPWVIDL